MGKTRSSQNASKHGISKLQKELRQLLKEQKKVIEVVSKFSGESTISF